MRIPLIFFIIGFLFQPIFSEDIEVSLDDDVEKSPTEHGGSISLLSSEFLEKSFTWDIAPPVNGTNQTEFIRSLVISNLALENGSSLTLTPNFPKSSKEVAHVFSISGEGVASLPILYLDINTHYKLTYDRSEITNDSKTLLQASHAQILNDACAAIEVTDKKSFKSYNYPNNYPLLEYNSFNTQCRNVSSPAASIYVTFIDVDLAEGHHLEFADNTGSINLTKTELPGDAILSNLTVINFLRSFNPDVKTSRNINDKLSGRGFNIELEPLECGGEIDGQDKGEHVFNSTETPEKCIWILSTKKDPNALKVLNFSLTDGLDNVIIHDSNSRKNKLMINRTGSEYLNSTSETIIIEFTSSNKSAATLTWTSFFCPDACSSGRQCINPSQRCNGINDCGDWSDEIHCNGSAPIPQPKPAPASGVPGLVVVFVIMPISIILGILGTIFVPRILARIRGGTYQEFREYPDVS